MGHTIYQLFLFVTGAFLACWVVPPLGLSSGGTAPVSMLDALVFTEGCSQPMILHHSCSVGHSVQIYAEVRQVSSHLTPMLRVLLSVGRGSVVTCSCPQDFMKQSGECW